MGCLLLSDEKANLLLLDENTNALALVMDLHPTPSLPNFFCSFHNISQKISVPIKKSFIVKYPKQCLLAKTANL